MIGLTYASVPLYRMFCGATGFGGIPQTDPSKFLPDRLYPDKDADLSDRITVRFEADASEDLKWKFTPQQKFVKVLPGETALAFYTAKNWGTEDVVGIATYNITPSRVGHTWFPLPVPPNGVITRLTSGHTFRFLRILPKSNVSALSNKKFEQGKKLICQSSSSSTRTSRMIPILLTSTTSY